MRPISTQNLLLKRSKQEVVFLASPMIERCVDVAAKSLEEGERRTGSVAVRQQMAEAHLALLKYRASWQSRFPGLLADAIDEALSEASEGVERRAPPVGEDAPVLAIMDDAEVSRFVELSRLQQAMMPVVEHSLARLDSLMSSVMGLPVVRADLNPLRPDVMCKALLRLFDAQPIEPHEHMHWTRHIAKPFAKELEQLYQTVIKLLEEQGVEEARYRLRLSEGGGGVAGAGGAGASGRETAPVAGGGGGGGGPGGFGPGGPVAGAVGALGDDADALRQRRAPLPPMAELARSTPDASRAVLRDFLYRPQWIAQYDEPLPAGFYDAAHQQLTELAAWAEPAYDAAARADLEAAERRQSVVDRAPRPVEVGMALPPEQWAEQASARTRTRTLLELKTQARQISQVLGLDAVRTLVGQVAADERVLAPVREAVVALEPALLRLAVQDPRFLGNDQHPARRLIEGVAQRSFRYNDVYAPEFEQFMAPVREAVRELDADTAIDATAFETRWQGLQSNWAAQDAGEEQAREKGLRSMRFAQERQALADKIAWEFSLRSDLQGVPGVVVDFLFRDWSLVIAHAQLTSDTGSQLDPGGYLAVVTDLLWSVKRDAVLKQPARLFEILPGMIQKLRQGLDMLGMDPGEAEVFFEALMRYHNPVLRLRRLRSARDAMVSGMGGLGGDSGGVPLDMPVDTEPLPLERLKPRAAEQPWLGRHDLVATGFHDEVASAHGALSGHAPLDSRAGFVDSELAAEVTEVASLPAPSPAADTVAPAAPVAPVESEDDARERARRQTAALRTGDWVDLHVGGKWRRAELSWTSDNGALFMFLSRGGRAHSMTKRTCERLMRVRHLRPVHNGAVVERAMRQIAQGPAPAADLSVA
ncbi:MAG: DUF1631 domain-containing protein [Proteobacteria bacterium]|nr:DUF1631 domain-containing protein [Pseudomonadota bacterium]